jgi:tetratricopeptide (TPR) repeat protein
MFVMKKVIITVVIVFSVLFLWGETYECVYIEGDASYLEGDSWEYLDFGTLLERGTKIRVEDRSIVQFESNVNSLFFSRQGEYILESSIPEKQGNALSKISQKMETLLTEKNHESTVAMGIRGDAVDLDDDLGFGSTSEAEMEYAWDLINDKNYAKAEVELEFLYEMSADPFSEGKLLYALAYAEEMQGKTGEAWRHLGDIVMPETGDYYPGYLLLSGQIAMKGQNYVEAASSFSTYLKVSPQDPTADDVKELLQFCESKI